MSKKNEADFIRIADVEGNTPLDMLISDDHEEKSVEALINTIDEQHYLLH